MPRVLVTVPEKNPQPYRFDLDSQLVTMGRGSRNHIVMDCESVSVSHAEMRRIPGGFELVDLESTNGIKLDGWRSEVVSLESGMILELGDVTFEFQLSDEEQVLLKQEVPATSLSEENEVDEVEEPASKPVKRTKPKALPSQPTIGAGTIFGFLVLAMIAFAIGMAVRFEKDTGKSWIEAVMSRSK